MPLIHSSPRSPIQTTIADATRAFVRTQWLLPAHVPVPLTEWLEASGIRVVSVHHLAAGAHGATKYTHGWAVIINADDPLVVQRFTLAHELAHVVLGHPKLPSWWGCETEANTAASELLLPWAWMDTVVRATLPAEGLTLATLTPWMRTTGNRLAAAAQVSAEVFLYHLRDCGWVENAAAALPHAASPHPSLRSLQ